MRSGMKKISIIILSLFLLACNSEKEKKPQELLIKIDSGKIVAPVEPAQAEKLKYTGTFNIIVTRFEGYQIGQTLELTQIGDSVKGIYKRDFFVKGNDPFASFVANVEGRIRKFEEAESVMFGVEIKSYEIDSVRLKQHNWAEKMAGEFKDGPALYIRFSETNNSIEDNYAGGAWDTWTRIN
jgi:hypothetical protein